MFGACDDLFHKPASLKILLNVCDFLIREKQIPSIVS